MIFSFSFVVVVVVVGFFFLFLFPFLILVSFCVVWRSRAGEFLFLFVFFSPPRKKFLFSSIRRRRHVLGGRFVCRVRVCVTKLGKRNSVTRRQCVCVCVCVCLCTGSKISAPLLPVLDVYFRRKAGFIVKKNKRRAPPAGYFGQWRAAGRVEGGWVG